MGDKIATLVSLSLTPLNIEEITQINLDTEQVFCKAGAILFESGIFTKTPEDLGEKLSLAIMDVAGAPAQVAMNAKPNDTVVILGTYEQYIEATGGQLADFAVSAVNVPNTELTIIMLTKDEGKLYFFSMSTDFVKASLGAEGIKKHTTMVIGNGYYPGHAEIEFDIVRKNPMLRDYFEHKYGK